MFSLNSAIEEVETRRYAELASEANLTHEERAHNISVLCSLSNRYGPPLDFYPTWHPFVRDHDPQHPCGFPCDRTGYEGLARVYPYATAFIARVFPYAVEKFLASVTAKKTEWGPLDVQPLKLRKYSDDIKPMFLVSFRFPDDLPMQPNGAINMGDAVRLMLTNELKLFGELTEPWEALRADVLGRPAGARSSILVDQRTGQAMKNLWRTIEAAELFGPLKRY